MKFILEHTNIHKEKHYLVNLGAPWGAHGQYRLISETTADRKKAREFDSAPEAAETLSKAGDPVNWEIVPV